MDFLFAILFVIIVVSILHPTFRNIVLETGNKLGVVLKDAFKNKKNILKELFKNVSNNTIKATKLRVYYIGPKCSEATPVFKIKINKDTELKRLSQMPEKNNEPSVEGKISSPTNPPSIDNNQDCFNEYTIPSDVQNVENVEVILEDKQTSSDLKPIALVLYNDKVNVWSKVTNLKPSSNVFTVKEEMGKVEQFANQHDYRLEFFTVNP